MKTFLTTSTRSAASALTSFLLPALLADAARAQSTSATDGFTPSAIKPGSPSGSFALSGFETINPYNGGLNFSLPLLNIGGRGGAGYTIPLQVEQKWTATHDVIVNPETNQQWDFLSPMYNWWTGFRPGYGPGVMQGRQSGIGNQTCQLSGTVNTFYKTLTRLTFIAPDGTEYEFRDQLTNGEPKVVPFCQPHLGGFSRGTVFVTADGTSATFISDSTITDSIYGNSVINPSGYIMFRDGTRYRIDDGGVTWMRDRNGNLLTFNGAITDSLGRQVTIENDVMDVAPYGLCDRITYKGFGGATRVIRVSKTNLGNALRAGYSLRSQLSLFPSFSAGLPPIMPDGRLGCVAAR